MLEAKTTIFEMNIPCMGLVAEWMEVTEEEAMNLKIDEEKLSSLKKKLSSLFWRTERAGGKDWRT